MVLNTDEHLLYGTQNSGSAAIEAALTLARLPFRNVDAASWAAESDLEALREVSPLLQIPALRWPDGSTMTESAAILIELGLRHPDSGLLPAEPAARAQNIRGLLYIATNCYAAVGIMDYPERWTLAEGDAERQRLKQGTQARLRHLWERFADSFPADPFLGGEQPGALDLLAAVVSRWSGARAHLRAARPGWAGVLERIDQHPALAPVFARHWPATS
ncbi:glutathione S-transferase [Aquabacterium sp. A7-Y]|uniref:glutathione S-transferase family protein n=1 Tax=Aquabacterium sp. A7-Y TaxID=1349605 RepID=UPI00223CDD22|nr:glutathione S-transferase [Aquabacterium sp. A7-Y]MCW7538065.1 glutathione S-transferase [Aquabacterium sp. A7-Y]